MIELKNITKKFGSLTALNDLSLSIDTGTVYGLVGSNGSGKSTMLRTIAGVLQPEYGEVLIDNILSFENPEIKSKCFFISDYPFFYNDSTIENLASLYRNIYPNWNDDRYMQLCSVFPVKKRAKIITMSKGMQRQAALIIGLSTMPEIILLDEIFDGLDPVVRQLVKKVLADDVAERNMTVVIASHNLRELEDICNHVGFLHKGGIILENELDDLKLGIHKIQIAFSPVPEGELFTDFDIVKQDRRGSLFNLVVRGERDEIMEGLNKLNPVFLEALPLTLEEVFISEMEVAGYDIDNII